jgi:hypothetical protein
LKQLEVEVLSMDSPNRPVIARGQINLCEAILQQFYQTIDVVIPIALINSAISIGIAGMGVTIQDLESTLG